MVRQEQEGGKDETSIKCGWAGRWQFRRMGVDNHAARAQCLYLCACVYVGCADALCNGTLKRKSRKGPVNSESILI